MGSTFFMFGQEMGSSTLYNIPLAILVTVVTALMIVVLLFEHQIGGALKDLLSRFWGARRREVLYLEAQNGFFFFIDLFIIWSGYVTRLVWISAFLSLLGGVRSFILGLFLVSLCFTIRLGCLSYLARRRVKLFTLPLEYDGYGVYGRAQNDWRDFADEMRSPMIFSVCATVLFFIGVLTS